MAETTKINMETAPEREAGRPLRVLQITDTHLYGDPEGRLVGLNTRETYQDVLDKVLDEFWPADLVLATGDLVHDGTETGYKRFRQCFERLGVPTLAIPGNHDRPEVMKRLLTGPLVRNTGHAVFGRWQFVMLDSTVAGSAGGHLAEDQLELLERRLDEDRERHAVICLHHHPVSVECDWIDRIGVDNGERLFDVIDRFPQVKAVMWGHIHQEYDAERNGVRLLATPSTCIQFKPRQEAFGLDEVPPGYRWLRLYDDGAIQTGVVRLDALPADLDLRCEGYS